MLLSVTSTSKEITVLDASLTLDNLENSYFLDLHPASLQCTKYSKHVCDKRNLLAAFLLPVSSKRLILHDAECPCEGSRMTSTSSFSLDENFIVMLS